MADNPYAGKDYTGPSHDEAVAARGMGYSNACGFAVRGGGLLFIALNEVWPRNTRGVFRIHGEVVLRGKPTGKLVVATGYAESDSVPATYTIAPKK